MTRPRYEQIADALRERINGGHYADAALESEAQLGQEFETSRITVRKALTLLRDQGYVVSRQGLGWYAANGSAKLIGSFNVGHMARTAPGGEVRREIIEFGFSALSEAAAQRLGLDVDTKMLRAQYVSRASEVPFDLVTAWLPLPDSAGISAEEVEQFGPWEALRRRGTRLTGISQVFSAALATPADARLFDVEALSPLLVLSRVASNPDGVAVTLSEHRYVADRVQLEVQFEVMSTAAMPEPPGLRLIAPS